jgi:precorrin-6A/cobalt-precorrin-6A reductase
MILLLGGTGESVFLASRLAEQGYPILVSTATDIPLDTKEHPLITRRQGELREEDFMDLVRSQGIRAIVDATHPYAQKISVLAQKAAEAAAIPYFLWERPTAVPRDENFLFAKDHEEGAWLAFSFSKPVLLTTGSRNLEPYVEKSRQTQVPLWVRVLSHPDTIAACRQTGIPEDQILFGRGPFSVEDTRTVIKRYSIGVLVTKDSGLPGGVLEKLEAAKQEYCQVVVIERPESHVVKGYERIEDLLAALSLVLRVRENLRSKV